LGLSATKSASRFKFSESKHFPELFLAKIGLAAHAHRPALDNRFEMNPNGIQIIQPRVARTRYPGLIGKNIFNPERVESNPAFTHYSRHAAIAC
jgi:hypothetical protein